MKSHPNFPTSLRPYGMDGSTHRKGKPTVRWGRKVMDPALAGPPDCRKNYALAVFLFEKTAKAFGSFSF
jgi:hypothetical protein